MGGLLAERLGDAVRRHAPVLVEARSAGLLASLRTDGPATAAALSASLCRRGVLAMPSFGDGAELMFEPPLVITEGQVARVAAALDDSCREIPKEQRR